VTLTNFVYPLSSINSSAITLFLHAIDERLALTMFSTECRQFVRHGLAAFVYEHPFALVIDFQARATPAVEDGVTTELLYHRETTQARDLTQGMSLFPDLWHRISDEQAVRVAIINGEGDTIIDVMTLSLAHGTHPFMIIANVNNIFLIISSGAQPIISQQKSADRSSTICARNCSEECLSAQEKEKN